MTLGELTRLDPESCIAGEDGGSVFVCVRVCRGQILGTFIYFFF